MSYEDFIKEKFSIPMELEHTGVNISTADMTNFAKPYLIDNG